MKYFFFIALCATCLFACNNQTHEAATWNGNNLEEPANLAEKIKSGQDVPNLINIGPSAVIPTSLDAGMTGDEKGLENLGIILSSIGKTAPVVVYCGCCPFNDCPNIRPALALLKEQGFKNYSLLNLPQNMHADWISKGYPVNKEPEAATL